MRVKTDLEIWWWYSSCAVGSVTLALLLIYAAKTTFNTAICLAVDKRCEYSWGATDALQEAMASIIDGNKNVDVVVQPKSTPKPSK